MARSAERFSVLFNTLLGFHAATQVSLFAFIHAMTIPKSPSGEHLSLKGFHGFIRAALVHRAVIQSFFVKAHTQPHARFVSQKLIPWHAKRSMLRCRMPLYLISCTPAETLAHFALSPARLICLGAPTSKSCQDLFSNAYTVYYLPDLQCRVPE